MIIFVATALASRSSLGSFSVGGKGVLVVKEVYPLCLAQFLRDEKTFCDEMVKPHISIHHNIVSATQVSFAGQGLSLTYYLTSSVEHSQIYVYPLQLAPFL